ncbi:phage tail tape measure C-terminal domain-containing protein [Algihabitans albus]|uniref:phage tail tape measure C-terminal domain-containing protein n=1 Tax=Algihabitans albus TaxID=2164067 RepID=UPI000E5D3032|nr:phage tail tape measure C-terminal domain-containing protein [Algihabitans albus]
MTIQTGIRLTADASGLVTTLDGGAAAVNRLGQSGTQAQTGLNQAALASDRLGDEARQSAQGLAAQRQALQRSDAAARDASRRLATTTTGSRNMGFAAQNAAFQLGDMAVQIGGGTSAMRAMSQQLPQLLGGFGVWGAVIGAVVAVGGALAPMLLDIESASDRAADATDALADALDRAEELVGDQAEKVRDLARAYAEAAQAQRLLIEADFVVEMAQIRDGIEEQTRAIQAAGDELASTLALRAGRLDGGQAQGPIFPGGELEDEQARRLLGALESFDAGAGVEGVEQLGEALATLTVELDGTSPAFTRFADQVLEQVRQVLDGTQSLEEMQATLASLQEDAAAFAESVDPEVAQQTQQRADQAARAVEALRERIADLRLEAEVTTGSLSEIEGQVMTAALALQDAGVATGTATELLESYRFALEQVEIAESRQEARERHVEAVKAIGQAHAALQPQLEQSRAAAEAWRDEQLANLDETAEGYEGYVGQVEEVFQRRLADALDQNLRDSRHWRDGVVRALQDYEEAASDAGANAASAMTGSMRAIEDALVDGVESVSDFVDAIRREFQRAAIRSTITGPLAGFFEQSLGGFFGGLFGGGGSGGGGGGTSMALFHEGGLVGETLAPRKAVDPALFIGARRYHRGGLVSDEMPIVARIGEEVLTEADPRHRRNLGRGGSAGAAPEGGGTVVIIEDRRGAEAAPIQQEQRTRGDGTRELKLVIRGEMREAIDSGALDGPMERNYGVARRPRGGL